MFAKCKLKVSVKICGCITWYGTCTLCNVNDNNNAEKFISILDEQLWSVIVRHYLDNSSTFQDENAHVHRACIVERFKHKNNIYSCLYHITKYKRYVNFLIIFLSCWKRRVITHSEVSLIDVRHFSAVTLGTTLYMWIIHVLTIDKRFKV